MKATKLCFLMFGAMSPLLLHGAPDRLRESIQVFHKTREAINIRAVNSAPFHLHVTFHAFPGMELVAADKQQILSGDGSYDEVWLGPHLWRREVALGGYHATEVESQVGRKLQSTDDYEPARVLMLLSGLLDPVPRDLASVEFRHENAGGWSIDSVSLEGTQLARLSKTRSNQRGIWTDAYFVLPAGGFVLHNEHGLITSWESPVRFDGKEVPTRLRILASSDRELVSAKVSIEPAGNLAAEFFVLPGPLAEPGDTLRPLRDFEVNMPDLSYESFGGMASPLDRTLPAYSIHGVLDRRGHFRELEMLDVVSESGAKLFLEDRRRKKFAPAKIDGSACELGIVTVNM